MTSAVTPPSRPRIVYPDTDGAPIAENTLQFEWIVTIKGGLDHLFAADPDVFVAGDLFWYPAVGHPEIVIAPDAMVVFGCPKGHRMSYLQWEEGGIPPQVVFEVLSPGNRFGEMLRKFEFYQRYGVEEYYVYNPDPEHLELSGFLRRDDRLIEVPRMNGHTSPRLNVRFELSDAGLRLIRPDGRPFLTFEETAQREEQQRHLAEQERRRAEQERELAEQERNRAEQERHRADQERNRAEQERSRADQAASEVERMRERLRSLGQDPG